MLQLRHAALELAAEEHGGGADSQEVRHWLRQKHSEGLVGKEERQNIDQGDQQNDLPQDGQKQGGLGIAQGDTVKVSSNRGYIKAKAVVTKRIRTLKANGKDIDTIGIPIHWGYEGVAKKGFIANTLTPFVGDANTQTPEFKSFLVNVEKV